MSEPIAELGGRKWAELEVLEHEDGQLLFPAELRRRDKTGAVVTKKVRFRLPSPLDTFKARVEARKAMADIGLLEAEDRERFEQIEQLVLLSFAIRTFEPPHAQFTRFMDLATFDEGCLKDIQEQINRRKAELDPRESITTEEDSWRAIIETARRMDTTPLADIDGRDQHALVVLMALQACRSPTGRRWLQSFGISIPESSPSSSSAES